MPDRGAARKLSRREELGVESRRKIVDAAAALMAERGFAGTSIAAVSQRSGLPSGSIYWHFESKEALLGAVMEEGARRWFDALPKGDSLPTEPGAASRVPPAPAPDRSRAARGRRDVPHGDSSSPRAGTPAHPATPVGPARWLRSEDRRSARGRVRAIRCLRGRRRLRGAAHRSGAG